MELRQVMWAPVIGLVIVVVSACGGPSTPTPTPIPPGERTATAAAQATATASAESALLPCLLDAETRDDLRQLADELWDAGTTFNEASAGSGLRFYGASIAYDLLTDCRELDGAPACPAEVAAVIGRLNGAVLRGTDIRLELLVSGIGDDTIELMDELDNLLSQRATELEMACGLRLPGTPIPTGSPAPTSA